MKKVWFILICSIFVLALLPGDVFAQNQPVGIKKPAGGGQRVQYSNPSCGNVVSIKNDGSMPKDSLTQRWKITCDLKGRKGQAGEETIEITISKDGKRITGAKVVGTTKAMGPHGMARVIAEDEDPCGKGKTMHCAQVCYVQGKNSYCKEV
jgi:hypothetical protein